MEEEASPNQQLAPDQKSKGDMSPKMERDYTKDDRSKYDTTSKAQLE